MTITPLLQKEPGVALTRATPNLNIPDNGPTVVFCDNKAAVQLSDGDTSSKRMIHIATRIAFLREQVHDKSIMLYHIGAEGQLADIFTKPLGPTLFHSFRQELVHSKG